VTRVEIALDVRHDDPKERAEHLMLLDLGRNDAGRVSRIGSVRVTDSFARDRAGRKTRRQGVERVVTRVEIALDVRHDVHDRAMEIIDELEREKRGPYAGCIGYFGARGEMDTCIVPVPAGKPAARASSGS
jgi:anthranilate synthase component 1